MFHRRHAQESAEIWSRYIQKGMLLKGIKLCMEFIVLSCFCSTHWQEIELGLFGERGGSAVAGS